MATDFHAVVGGKVRIVGGMIRNFPAGATGIVIPIETGGTISGVVVDEEGRPMAQVPVYAKALRWKTGEPVNFGDPGRGGFGVSGPDGSFTIDGLGNCIFHLTTGGSGTLFARLEQEGEVAVGATGVRVRAQGGVSISGTLLGTDGKPVEWLYAIVWGKDGKRTHAALTSEEDGSITLTGLAPGPVHIGATLRGMDYDPGTVTAPSVGLVLGLPE